VDGEEEEKGRSKEKKERSNREEWGQVFLVKATLPLVLLVRQIVCVKI
jgi:hypothetical protein